MNGRCETCSVEKVCAYPYKPTECCDQRKFVQTSAGNREEWVLIPREKCLKWARDSGAKPLCAESDFEFLESLCHRVWNEAIANAAMECERQIETGDHIRCAKAIRKLLVHNMEFRGGAAFAPSAGTPGYATGDET